MSPTNAEPADEGSFAELFAEYEDQVPVARSDRRVAGRTGGRPGATDDDVEDLRANCGIGIVRSSWVKVDNLLLRDANLHNIAFYKTLHCEATRLESTGCNDKNIRVLAVGEKLQSQDSRPMREPSTNVRL